MRDCNPEYLKRAQKLSKLERERLLSRMEGKLPRRLEKEKITTDEAIAIQLELEDEQLDEWRMNFQLIKDKVTEKERIDKAKSDTKSK